MREVCALRHLSINTERSYIHWLGRYASFLKEPKLETLTPEQKIEAFLTRLAKTGVSASTQNQALNALLFFYRSVLKRELGPVDSLRAKRPVIIRQCRNVARYPVDLATAWARGRSRSVWRVGPWKRCPKAFLEVVRRSGVPQLMESWQAGRLNTKRLGFARSSRIHEGNSTAQFAAVHSP